MMRRLAAVTVTALLSAAALASGSGAAQASSVHLLGSLHLKRVDTLSGQTHVTYLVCTSTTKHGSAPVIHGFGGLKDATSACEELAAAHGKLDTLSVHPAWLPPALEAPVEVRAAGTWEGAKVAWTHRYSNGGWLAKRTGDVFAF
jgi:hypothetical protein